MLRDSESWLLTYDCDDRVPGDLYRVRVWNQHTATTQHIGEEYAVLSEGLALPTGYNRAEHLRAFLEHDPVFIEIQRRLRASAESANRIVDDHLPRERLHHFGFEKGQLSMLAWQAHRNAQTEAIFSPAMGSTSAAALALVRSA